MEATKPLTLADILAMEDIGRKISLLQNRSTPAPNAVQLYADWETSKHRVMDKSYRKDNKRKIKDAIVDKDGKFVDAPAYEPVPVNRIPIPLEQDIVNVHTAFAVGIPPKLECEPSDEGEQALLDVILSIDKKNKTKYQNKRIVRSWLSEQEVAEYWYVVKDDGFWRRIVSKIKGAMGKGILPSYKLKSVIWSPFRGDTLYPFFDETGNLLAVSRRYKVKYADLQEIEYFMTVTDEKVYTWRMSGVPTLEKEFRHNFKKMPVIYAYREKALCAEIKPIRERIETLLSNFADAIDYHFFPYLIVEGEINGMVEGGSKNKMIKVENGGKAYYLDWNQTPEMIRLEIDGLWERVYAMTHTPRLSVENLKGLGNVLSGAAFRYTFMGAHMAVENHAETIEEFLQRRYNFLVSAVASLNPTFEEASQTIDISPQLVPFIIDDMAEKVKVAVDAVSGGVASLRTGVVMAGIVDEVEDELKAIEEGKATEESKGQKEPPTK
jgi:hypothetical protein